MSRSPPAGNGAFGFCLDCVCLLTPETRPLPHRLLTAKFAWWLAGEGGRSCAALSRTKHAERSSPHFMGCAKPPQSPTKPPFAPTKPPPARPDRVRNKTPIPASCGSLCKTQHPCKSPPLRSAREHLQNPICSVTRSNPSPTREERTTARHESTPRRPARRGKLACADPATLNQDVVLGGLAPSSPKPARAKASRMYGVRSGAHRTRPGEPWHQPAAGLGEDPDQIMALPCAG